MSADPTEADAVFDASGEATHTDDPASGLAHLKARDTVNMAIAKLTARRIEGYMNGDEDLVAAATADIGRASEVLGGLDPSDPSRAEEVHAEYLAICQSVPTVPTEVLDRYDELRQKRNGAAGDR